MNLLFRLSLAGLLSLPILCLAQEVTLVLKPSQPASAHTIGVAPHQLVISPVAIRATTSDKTKEAMANSTAPNKIEGGIVSSTTPGKPVGATLKLQPLPVDLDDDTPYGVAQQLLHELRRAARRDHATRKAVKASETWKPLLLPYRNLLRRKFTAGRRRAVRMFLATAQAEIERQFDKEQDDQSTALTGSGVNSSGGVAGTLPPLPGGTPPAPGASPSVLYRRETVFTTFNPASQRADHRILGITLTDAGANTTDGEHYRVCVRYSTQSGTFVSGITSTTEPNSCPPQPNTVTAYLKFSSLDRALFVEKILEELQTGRLIRTDSAPTDYSQVVAASDELVQTMQSAYATLTNQQKSPGVLRDSLDGLRRSANLDRVQRQNALRDSLQQHNSSLEDSVARRQFKKEFVEVQTTADKNYAALKTKLGSRLTKATADSIEAPKISAVAIQKARTNLTTATQKTIPPVTTAKEAGIILDLQAASPNSATLREALENVYLDYMREQTLLLAAPVAGTLDLLPAGNVYYPRITHQHGTFLLDSLEMEVEDGAVMGLKMMGRMGGKSGGGQKVSFESRAPIGISSDRDLNREWAHQRIWLQYPLLNHGPPHDAYVRLTDLLRYYPRLNAQGGDRSPADGVYRVRINDALPRRTFTKIATAKLLQARIYTDLNGIRADNPNGLVQLEIDKKFVFGAPWSKASPSFQMQTFGYFTPFVSINKIEQQNRYLPLRPTATPGAYEVNTIELLRYTYLRVGGDLNLAGLRLPRFKSDFAFDFGFGLQRVDIHDTKLTRLNRPSTAFFAVDSALNVGSYGFALKARIRPESRIGLLVRVGYYRYTLFNDRDGGNNLRIAQLPNSDRDGPYTVLGGLLYRYWYQGVIQYEMTGRFKISENAEYFARAQFSNLFYQSNRTFVQLQTGFQFDVFGPRREAPPGPASVWMTSVGR